MMKGCKSHLSQMRSWWHRDELYHYHVVQPDTLDELSPQPKPVKGRLAWLCLPFAAVLKADSPQSRCPPSPPPAACRRLLHCWSFCAVLAAMTAMLLLLDEYELLTAGHPFVQLQRARVVYNVDNAAGALSEYVWKLNVALHGSELQACTAATDPGETAALQRFDDSLLLDSADGRGYEVSPFPPSTFSSSYSPATNVSLLPARPLACSTRSLRCESSTIERFLEELQAEQRHSQPRWPFDSSAAAGQQQQQQEAQCGTGALSISPSQHWWYYRHPMSCMRLVRRIDSRHRLCLQSNSSAEPIIFHLTMFGAHWRQQASHAAASVLLSQDLSQSRLWIWLDRPLSNVSNTAALQRLLQSPFAPFISVHVYSAMTEILNSNTVLASAAEFYAGVDDSRGWVRGDLMRLLLLHNYGGLYLDADTLLLRDLSPVLNSEFLYAWGSKCHSMNGAVMRLHRHSAASRALLSAVYHTPPRPDDKEWGDFLYTQVHAKHPELFTVFPACFFNPNWMLPEMFSPLLRRDLPQLLPSLWDGPFAYHLHGEIWDEKGFASQDPSYRLVTQRLTELLAREIERRRKAEVG